MTKRKGAAKGSGSGYKNLPNYPKDPKVHSMSAKGMKQPQSMRLFNEKYNVGKAKYVVNYHNGKKTHSDGSPFFDIKIFKNKVEFQKFKNELAEKGYRYDTDGDGVPDAEDCQPMNPYAQADYKTWNVKKGVDIIASYEKTRNGFRHIAVMTLDGVEVGRAKVTYLNRTWESFEFETAIRKLLDSTDVLTPDEEKKFLDKAAGREREEVDAKFKRIAAIAQMGEMFNQTKKEKTDWKVRMLKAGLPGLDVPDDWDKLSESEKEKRLNKVIALMKGKN